MSRSVQTPWMSVLGIVLCACGSTAAEPADGASMKPAAGSSPDRAGSSVPPSAAPSSPPSTALPTPSMPAPSVTPTTPTMPTAPVMPTTPAMPATPPPAADSGPCPSVFSEPFAPGNRTDAGPRGLAALRAEVEKSRELWKQLSAANDGHYSYTRSVSSFTGWSCKTTIHFDAGEPTSRTQLIVSPGSGREGERTEMLWTETAADLDTHSDDCFPLQTLDELYAQCSNDVLCRDPQRNSIYLELDEQGLLETCAYFPMLCADDCLEGVTLDAVRVGDAAPQCCPLEDSPACCMSYGGADVDGCPEQCDGMPPPSAPWTHELDEYGCPRWVEPEAGDDCCGCPP